MAVKLNKKNKDAHLIMAFAVERLPDRVARLKSLIGQYPDFSRAHNALGWIYHQQHYNKAAKQCFTISHEARPNYYAPVCGLAQTHRAQKEYKEA